MFGWLTIKCVIANRTSATFTPSSAMGFRYTTCLEPNGKGSESFDRLVASTCKMSVQHCQYYEYRYDDEDDDEDDEDEDDDTDDARAFYGGRLFGRPSPFFCRYSSYNVNGKAITYGCGSCLTHVCSSSLIISDKYNGSTGQALLIYDVVNAQLGAPRVRRMTTGVYTVADLLCSQCGKYLGWKYLKSSDEDQKFKEGRYILEVALIERVDP